MFRTARMIYAVRDEQNAFAAMRGDRRVNRSRSALLNPADYFLGSLDASEMVQSYYWSC